MSRHSFKFGERGRINSGIIVILLEGERKNEIGVVTEGIL